MIQYSRAPIINVLTSIPLTVVFAIELPTFPLARHALSLSWHLNSGLLKLLLKTGQVMYNTNWYKTTLSASAVIQQSVLHCVKDTKESNKTTSLKLPCNSSMLWPFRLISVSTSQCRSCQCSTWFIIYWDWKNSVGCLKKKKRK